MGVRTLALYLAGNRDAILQIASNRWAVAVGFLFVLSAGLAREYDGEDLIAEPWHLLLPLGASLVSATLLFSIGYLNLGGEDCERPPAITAYHGFLGLFWLTAPLAWLYAIPYERFLSPAGAVYANLTTLAVVSFWRVALMVRVFNLLMGYSPLRALLLVLVFADGVALIALSTVTLPLMATMGGIRVSESEQVLRAASANVFCLGLCAFPFVFIAAVSLRTSGSAGWRVTPMGSSAASRPTFPLWLLAFGAVAVWVAVLPLTQPEQQLRWRVEHAFVEGRIADALEEMSAHQPTDFPPHWDPPPRHFSTFERFGSPHLLDIWKEIIARPPAPWVRGVYLGKLRRWLRHCNLRDDLEGAAQVLLKLPEREELLGELGSTGNDEVARLLKSYLQELDGPKKSRKNASH